MHRVVYHSTVSLLFILGILVLSSVVLAQNWYVNNQAANCDNAGPGTQTTPLCDITAANDRHAGGDHVYILPGIYRESIFLRSGTPDAYTTYEGVGALGQVVISGSDVLTSWTQCSAGDTACQGLPASAISHVFYAPFRNNAGPRCSIHDTDCWEDDTTWLALVDSLAELDAPGEYYYSYDLGRVWVYRQDSDAPGSSIECSARKTAPWSEYTPAERPSWFTYPSYLTIKNLKITHSYDDGMTLEDVKFINIVGNELAFNSGGGSCGSNPSALIFHKIAYRCDDAPVLYGLPENCFNHDLNVSGNFIHDQSSDLGPSATFGHSGTGIETYALKNSIIQNNRIENATIGVYLKSFGKNITVFNNTLNNIYSYNIQLQVQHEEHVISGNRLTNCQADCIIVGGASRNIRIFNNDFYQANRALVMWDEYGLVENVSFKDNVVMDSGVEVKMTTGSAAMGSSDYNDWYDPSGLSFSTPYGGFNSLTAWQTTGFDAHSFSQDPAFLSENTYSPDFLKPSATSPVVDKGVLIPGFHCPLSDEQGGAQLTGCRHWSGQAPDIGALEYTTGAAAPVATNVQCLDGSSWVSCTSLAYGDRITQVRADCVQQDAIITSARFKLEGLADVFTYFDQSTSTHSGNTFTLDNPDVLLEDSGDFRISASCTNAEGVTGGTLVTWSIPWGGLATTQLTPMGNTQVQQGQAFTYTTRMTCTGGECGITTVTLDPLLSQGKPTAASSFRNTGEEPFRAVDGSTSSRWVAEQYQSPDQWISVDLGQPSLVDQVVLTWSNIWADSYTIETSLDNQTWGTVQEESAGQGGIETIDIPPTEARYVKLHMTAYGGPDAEYQTYTLSEMQVYGTNSTTPYKTGAVPTKTGALPFYTTSQNPQLCNGLHAGEQCTSTWTVIPTATNGTYTFFAIYRNDRSGTVQSTPLSITITNSACPLAYDAEPCGCITNVELINAISSWYQGGLDIPGLMAHIAAWKANSSC